MCGDRFSNQLYLRSDKGSQPHACGDRMKSAGLLPLA